MEKSLSRSISIFYRSSKIVKRYLIISYLLAMRQESVYRAVSLDVPRTPVHAPPVGSV